MRWPFLPPKGSLQRRLSLGLAIGVTGLWLAATLGAGLILRGELDEVFDSALQEVAQRVLPLAYIEVLDRDNAAPDDVPAQRIASVSAHEEYITYIVRDAKGRVLLQSHDADPAAFPNDLRPGFHDSPQLRLYTESAVQGTLFVTAAELPSHRRKVVVEAMGMLVWPLAALLPLSLLGVWALVGLSLRPVLALQGEIESRGRGNLSPVGAKALPAEIGPVADAVNRLIARLRRALEAERSFTANSAHELRTPIAAALAQAQRLLAEMPDGPTRERARTVEAALRQLSRLSEKLLQLAKAEGGGLLAETPQDLARVLGFVLNDVGRDPETAKRLHFTLPPEGSLASHMDADAFAILARNLVENALKHGLAAAPVTITLSGDGILSVANSGPVVPAETLARLKHPFERGATGAKGSGLGLAIAEAIANGSGGRLELFSPVPGQSDGFEARFNLPESRASNRTPNSAA
jgi:two-component system OmpR family sensor kinase